MKNIVVAIEFEKELDDVIEFTSDLLSSKNAEAHVVHACQVHTIENYEDYLQKQAASVDCIVSKLKDRGIRAQGYMKPLDNNLAGSIVEFSNKKKADLIVVGTRQPSRTGSLLLGSVAEKIVRQSDTPVVVVPRNSRIKETTFQATLAT